MLGRHVLAAAVAAVVFAPLGARAKEPIKIGFPIPLSGPTALYGVPILKGAQLAVADINAKGGVLGRKLELLPRDSKASADEAVRVSRELVIKDGVNFLAGTLTSSEAPAVSTVAKENKIVFISPSAKTVSLTGPANIHPYIFRTSSNTGTEGQTGAILMAKYKDIKTLATIAPDYAYGRDAISAFVAKLKELRPDIKIVDEEWPSLGQANFSPFISAMMSKHPDAVYCDEFAGDFVTFVKQATPLGFFKAIHNRFADGGETGSVDIARVLGDLYPVGTWASTYDPVIWDGPGEPAAHRKFDQEVQKALKDKYGSSWAIQGYISIQALAAGVRKAHSVDDTKVAAAMLGMTIQTPTGPRTFSTDTHQYNGELWGVMVKKPGVPFLIMKDPTFYDPEPHPAGH
ncbi:MAG: ABC transporter substrate-binding protein [Acetobacteraceae bacterium]